MLTTKIEKGRKTNIVQAEAEMIPGLLADLGRARERAGALEARLDASEAWFLTKEKFSLSFPL